MGASNPNVEAVRMKMDKQACFFVRAADEEPICGLHKEQLSIESNHGNLDPREGLLCGRCPVSHLLLCEESAKGSKAA